VQLKHRKTTTKTTPTSLISFLQKQVVTRPSSRSCNVYSGRENKNGYFNLTVNAVLSTSKHWNVSSKPKLE